MGRFLAVILAVILVFSSATPAMAEDVAGLVPCGESPAYIQRAKNFRNTTPDPLSGQKRAERYAQALCGPEGLPHLIVDGRYSHAGDFLIPSILFIYITGWIGWVGRAYLIAIRSDKDKEMKEIVIDVPLAIGKMLTGFIWPIAAVQELVTGKLTVPDDQIPVSPR